MADTGWLNCSSAANDGSAGTQAWSYATRVYADDANYAEAGSVFDPAGPVSTQLLACKGFGAAVPSGATINGVEFRVKHYGTGAERVKWGLAKIIKADGTYGSTDKGPDTTVPASAAYESVGGAADVWGESLTAAWVNDADFGVVLQYDHTAASAFYAYVGHVQAKITYTAAAATRDAMTAVQAVC